MAWKISILKNMVTISGFIPSMTIVNLERQQPWLFPKQSFLFLHATNYTELPFLLCSAIHSIIGWACLQMCKLYCMPKLSLLIHDGALTCLSFYLNDPACNALMDIFFLFFFFAVSIKSWHSDTSVLVGFLWYMWTLSSQVMYFYSTTTIVWLIGNNSFGLLTPDYT